MKSYIITVFLFSFSFSVNAFEFQCPAAIDTNQSLVKPLEGWVGMVDKINGRQNFENMQVYSGNPEEGAALKPDFMGPKKVPTWTIDTSRVFWIACFYWQSTVRLIKELPKSIKKCSLTYKMLPGAQKKIADKLICQ